MFTGWTKPVPFWNVVNTGPALTCSQGGQNQSPSGMFWTLVQHLHVHKVDKTSSLLECSEHWSSTYMFTKWKKIVPFWKCSEHWASTYRVDKTSPLLECPEHWSSTYMFTRSTKPVPFWKCSEHWSSTYMFTRWTKPVPFWNVLNIGPALTCSQGGQNQSPSGMFWTLVQHLHVHRVDKTSSLLECSEHWSSTYMFTKWKKLVPFWKCSEHWASTYRVDKTSPLLECPEHWSSTYMFTGWTKPVPFWKCSEHWSSTYMFTRWTKPVPFWNVLNIGSALTCSQGGQNQSPSGMFWTLVQHLHVHRVDKTSSLLKCSEHWSSTYMFTGWTKPVPFWNVLNIGPALTCSQGGQNQSPSGMAMSGGRRQAMW